MSAKSLTVHLDESLYRAVVAWAAAEERSATAQVRKVLRDVVPPAYVLDAENDLFAEELARR